MSDEARPSAAARWAASLLIEALHLPEDVDTIAAELMLVDDAPGETTFAAEFASSAGAAAFLVYVFSFAKIQREEGRPVGRAAFDEAMTTLLTAAERNAPGPRVVAHAVHDEAGIILATSPAVLRALSGGAPPAPEVTAWRSPAERRTERDEQAEQLLRALRAADQAAERWLRAMGDNLDDAAAAEIELALFLNDERSIRHLLQSLNVVLSATPKRSQ